MSSTTYSRSASRRSGWRRPRGQAGVPSYLADKAQGIKTVGGISELNLEAIAALKPDLILGSKLRANDLYDKLSAIAPTVFSIRPGFPWKENFLLVADAVGEEDKATGILNDYQKRADEVKSKVQGTPTISLVRFRPAEIRLYGNLSFIGVILKDIGLPRPKIQDVQDLAVEVSQENIGQGRRRLDLLLQLRQAGHHRREHRCQRQPLEGAAGGEERPGGARRRRGLVPRPRPAGRDGRPRQTWRSCWVRRARA